MSRHTVVVAWSVETHGTLTDAKLCISDLINAALGKVGGIPWVTLAGTVKGATLLHDHPAAEEHRTVKFPKYNPVILDELSERLAKGWVIRPDQIKKLIEALR